MTELTRPATPLADGFTVFGEADWRVLAEKALKGRPFDSLLSRTEDGIAVAPLYPPADAAAAPARPLAAPWRVVQRLDHPVPAAANAQVLDDLHGGASGLAIILAGAPTAYGYGLVADDLDALDRALADVILDALPIRLEAGAAAPRAAALLLALAERRAVAPEALDAALGLDPLGTFAASGRMALPWPATLTEHAEIAASLARHRVGGSWFLADGRPWHAAGATDAQELAAVVAAGVAYLRLLAEAGVDEAPARRIGFAISADVEQFATIAKVRALRALWAEVLADSGHPPVAAQIHAETAWRSMTRRDPYTNLLRATVAAFAAGVGGADSVTALPFTQPLGLPDGFARRIGRNLQTILLEESNLWRVADPAAGSGAVEAMTEALAAAAWDGFRAIERSGGLAAAIEDGGLAGAVAAARDTRFATIANRRRPITGTSEFPNLGEGPVSVVDVARPVAGAPIDASFETHLAAARGDERETARRTHAAAGPRVAPLAPHRIAEPFERLRDAADAHAARTGAPPTAFLAAIGPVAAHGARTMWTRNLLAAGGIAATAGDGYPDIDAAVAAYRASGAPLACLSATDAVYAESGPAMVTALAAVGPVVVAGRPDPALREAGAAAFLSAGADAVAALAALQRLAGVA